MPDIYEANTEPVEFEEFYRGDDFAIKIELEDEDQEGVFLSLVGLKFWLTMKLSSHQSDEEAAIQVSAELLRWQLRLHRDDRL